MFSTCSAFLSEFNVCEDDIIVSNAYIFRPAFEHLGCRAQTLFLEDYGQGEPSDIMVDALLASAATRTFHRIIAIGGGSVIDVAKLLAVAPVGSNTDSLFTEKNLRQEKELIILPTTCGTGSEVTNIAIVNRTRLGTKMGIADDSLYARHAVLVPELLENLPYPVFATSSLDALVHAVESFLSPAASPFTRMFAKEAIHLILNGYDKIRRDKGCLKKQLNDFLLASTYAGLSFGVAGCATVHALSYPLGALFHIPHGESNYAGFSGVLRHYEKRNAKDFSSLLTILALELSCSPKKTLDALDDILQAIYPRKRLSEYGMAAIQIKNFAETVLQTQQRLLVNSPEKISAADICAIYADLL